MFLFVAAVTCLSYGLLNVEAVPAPGHGALAGFCATSSDCQPDECCVTVNQPKGKRAVTSVLTSAVSGNCVKKGTSGSRCLANQHYSNPTNGLYYSCPCAPNHYCRGTGRFSMPLGEIGTCHANITAASTHFSHTLNMPCSRGSECATSECCVSSVRPLGKRSLGQCKVMGTRGSKCFVKGGSGKPSQVAFGCPCTSGLTCHGSGMFDIPLGEMGVCQ